MTMRKLSNFQRIDWLIDLPDGTVGIIWITRWDAPNCSANFSSLRDHHFTERCGEDRWLIDILHHEFHNSCVTERAVGQELWVNVAIGGFHFQSIAPLGLIVKRLWRRNDSWQWPSDSEFNSWYCTCTCTVCAIFLHGKIREDSKTCGFKICYDFWTPNHSLSLAEAQWCLLIDWGHLIRLHPYRWCAAPSG